MNICICVYIYIYIYIYTCTYMYKRTILMCVCIYIYIYNTCVLVCCTGLGLFAVDEGLADTVNSKYIYVDCKW